MKILPKMPKRAIQRMLIDSLLVIAQRKSRCRRYLQENPVPEESPVRLEEGDSVHEHRDSGEASNNFGIDPLAVSVGVSLASRVQVDTVEAGDGDGEDKLEESKNEADQRAEDAAAAGAVTEKVESAHVGRRMP